METEKNFDPITQNNQFIGNTYTLIDSEFIKKDQAETINKLKTKFSFSLYYYRNIIFLLN